MLSDLAQLLPKVTITFFLTNIQDVVILINFFLESAKPTSELRNSHVVLGQYLGFSTLLSLSLIGYAISYILPVKLFGFLGFVIIGFGLNGLYQIFNGYREKRRKQQSNKTDLHEKEQIVEQEQVEFQSDDPIDPCEIESRIRLKKSICDDLKNIAKVSVVTIANGNDNIAIYVPIFVQSTAWEIVVYFVGFLMMVAVLCTVCYCFIHFPPIFRFAQKYAQYISPFIFIALGIYILIDSKCFPWLFQIIRTGQWTID
jgi:cadmium resistance protein CadD (predicted permease)